MVKVIGIVLLAVAWGGFTIVSHAVYHRSNMATIVEIYFRVLGTKDKFSDKEACAEYIEQRCNVEEYTLNVKLKSNISEGSVNDCKIYNLSQTDTPDHTILDGWNNRYDNVVICCTIKNPNNADKKLSVFRTLPIKHKCITVQLLIKNIDIEKYLVNIELVVVGDESDYYSGTFDYDWILSICEQCIRKNARFEFRQSGTHFIKEGKEYKLQTKDLCSQARNADVDFKPNR